VATVKRETRIIERQCWETFVSRIEREIYAYKLIKNVNRTEKDNLQINPISEHISLDYYKKNLD
jgi:hypothetical protein